MDAFRIAFRFMRIQRGGKRFRAWSNRSKKIMKRITFIAASLGLPMFVLFVWAITTEGAATLVAGQVAPPDAVTADPARYSVLFENNVASLIRVKYPAGARSAMHSHPAGCAIFYKDSKFRVTGQTGESRTVEYRAGDVTCSDAYSHLPENVGSDTEFVLLHLKNRKTFDHLQTGRSLVVPSQPKVPDAIDADPAHYSVQFENDVVRLTRIKVPGGVNTPMHAHLAYCIVEIREMETGVKAGDSSCGDAMAHASQNNAKSLNEAITIEFKNRDRFKP
jgi:quercetin dioxygenase-like cupin family protein